MATTITLIIFISKLCHLTLALADPNGIHPSNAPIPSSSVNINLAESANDRRPEIDSHSQNCHILRDKRNVNRGDKNFIRLGRDGEEYSRLARAEKNLIRFGRNENLKGNGFIRFGRSDKGLIRFGRNDNSESMRFGRRGDKFIRFGRSNGSQNEYPVDDSLNAIDSSSKPISRPGRNGKYIRFGRGDNGFIRLGKKDKEFNHEISSTDDFDGDEKIEDSIVEQDDTLIPLQAYLYDLLRTEADDIEKNNVSPGTPSDDGYLMNVKLNYDKSSLKNNLL